jgi:hydroxyacylglutathione hydrolase
MKVEQIYTGCLAQGAYFIQSGNEAAIIDPLREIKSYLDKATKEGAKIKYVFETHFHADFVSGHLDLSKATGAKIVYGPGAETAFDAVIAKDGEVFRIGDVTITALHTPGHTLESTTYLLKDENGKDYCIFSGDTLFIGDVGRPDLAQQKDINTSDLAGMLYDSLRTKIVPLADDVLVYPAHGAGSACGKNMSRETFATLGHQKINNYALRDGLTKEEFTHELIDGLPPPPAYFPENVRLNRQGYESIDVVLERGERPLTADEFEKTVNDTGALILDTRKATEFAKMFIPNSINIGIDGGFAPWVGTLITDINQPILIVADKGRETEVITRLARVGYDNTLGFLEGGIHAWQEAGKETDSVKTISADDFSTLYSKGISKLIDVRKVSEYNTAHLRGAKNIPLELLSENMNEFGRDEVSYLHCASGYRSMIAASILKARGFDNLVNIESNFGNIVKAGVPSEN